MATWRESRPTLLHLPLSRGPHARLPCPSPPRSGTGPSRTSPTTRWTVLRPRSGSFMPLPAPRRVARLRGREGRPIFQSWTLNKIFGSDFHLTLAQLFGPILPRKIPRNKSRMNAEFTSDKGESSSSRLSWRLWRSELLLR
jgi:hypothetical protein